MRTWMAGCRPRLCTGVGGSRLAGVASVADRAAYMGWTTVAEPSEECHLDEPGNLTAETSWRTQRVSADDPGDGSPPDMTTIIMELQAGIRAIDACFDTLRTRVDRKGEQLDLQKVAWTELRNASRLLKITFVNAWRRYRNVLGCQGTLTLKRRKPGVADLD
ncbi:hypothetical protein NDU88_002767 [Pleurodeles waltl]|uniref:Uncharacterized protein n=1 Tax=Pleurodeles waltl TaxID=8319 RepID=A0AAV7LEQ2_PLEWA|nr:hypothetical protein NDU88_002767 [Pleurodeles waltl]